ncbi:alpha/beta hydrolase [Streptomyces sp. NPDC004838]
MTPLTLIFDNDPQFTFELVRTMGQASFGAAEIGECLATARRIEERNYDSWYEQWDTTAGRVHREAEAALAAGHTISARDGFLRAANYYRTAEFFLHADPSDARIRRASGLSVQCFRQAAALFRPVIEAVEIPYEDTTLPGYLYRPDGSDEPRPTVLIHNGFDGTGEECFSFGGFAGRERGYNVLVFEGPGQGRVIREQGLPFRPDWEKVVGPVIDFATARPDVDAERIALIGISMGGVLAPRAAAFDSRLAAVVAWDGVYDMAAVPLRYILRAGAGDAGADGAGAEREEELRRRLAAAADAGLDQVIARRVEEDPTTRWVVTHGSWVMGAGSPRALLNRFTDFSLRDGVAERITCPVLVMKGENDIALAGQPEALYEHLRGPKTFLEFTAAEGGDQHNQVDVLRHATARIYDWLDDTVRNR